MAGAQNLPAPQQVAVLTQKLYDPDPDFRYMSLNDLIAFLNTNQAAYLSSDYQLCAKVVEGLLHTLNDTNGEVQNLTIKCLGPFVLKCDPQTLCPLVHIIGTQTLDKTVDTSVTAIALRTIVVSLPRPSAGLPRTQPVKEAYSAVSRVLIPRLVGYIVIPLPKEDKGRPLPPTGFLQEDLEYGSDSNSIEILTEIAKCYGPMLQQPEVKALQQISMELLESEKSGSIMKKKAVAAISALAQYFSEPLLSSLLSQIIEKMRGPHMIAANRKLYFNLFSSMAKSIPAKFGPHLKTLAPFIISALSQQEIEDEMVDEADEAEHNSQADETREAAITALDSFYSSCGSDMHRFNKESLEALLRFLKYDPNMVDDVDGEDMDGAAGDEDEFDADEDFEQEDVVDDEDDVSWKVRRCAAKAIQTVLKAKGKEFLDNAESYERIARALIDRFKEREETVRVEVLQTTSFMVRQSRHLDPDAEYSEYFLKSEQSTAQQPLSRKRRRADSDTSMSDASKFRRLTGSVSPGGQSPLPSGAPSNLVRVGSDIVRGSLELALGSPAATKLASVTLLKDVVSARKGGVNDSLKELFGLITANIGSPTGASLQLSTSSGSLHIESLLLLSEIAKTTSSQALQPHIAKTIPTLSKAAQSKSPQLAVETLKTTEQLIKALTPPRTGHQLSNSSATLTDVLNLLFTVISNKSSDLLTRQQAIAVLGTLVGRTLSKDGSKLISQQQRESSLKLLADACQNETTRNAAIKAVDAMSSQGPDGVSYPKDWFTSMCIELGNQLRKQDRALRGASLQALRTLLLDRAGSKNLTDASPVIELLIPLLSSGDLHMVGPSIQILGALMRDSRAQVLTPQLISGMCELLKSPSSGSVVDQLSFFMDCAGRNSAAQNLMAALLRDVGVGGSATIVGKVVGDLLTSAGSNAGVSVNDFMQELQSTKDDRRRGLALSVLGEYGLRSGSSSAVKPDLFLSYFDSKDPASEVPMAAGMALGRTAAGAGNIKTCAPVILSRVDNKSNNVALHSIKELLQHCDDSQDLGPFIQPMWDAAVSTAKDDKARTIGAECLSKIAEMEPKTYLQALQVLLSSSDELTRLLSILALRDIFTYTDVTYNKYLRPIFVSILDTPLRDSSPENRRNALNTFGTAVRGKPGLTLPQLSHLLPLILDQTFEDPALVREVSIGPFKQKVDDGLEARKAAYETIYGLLEASTQALFGLLPKVFPRIVAGLDDDPAIRALCTHMLVRLAGSEPGESSRWLDDVAGRFEKILGTKLKDTAVRTEVEKLEETKRAVVKTSLQLARKVAAGTATEAANGVQLGQGGLGAKWQSYMENVRKEWAQVVKDEEKEMRER